MNKIKVIVIGVGHLGKHHARLYHDMPNVELAGIVDIDAKSAQKIAEQYQVPFFTDLEQITTSFDAASIVVPTSEHYRIAKNLLLKGIHILVEKPFTKTLEEAQELTQLAQQKNLIVSVGHVERFNPAFRQIEQQLNHPRFIEVHRLGPFPKRGTDVGVVLDLMIHDIDIILNIVKSPICDIRAVGIPVLTPYEDIANARLEFENGCVANVTASRVSIKAMRKIRIFQEDIYISLDYHKQKGRIVQLTGSTIKTKRIPINPEEPLKIELNHFIECIEKEKTPHVSAIHGLNALNIALKIMGQIKLK